MEEHFKLPPLMELVMFSVGNPRINLLSIYLRGSFIPPVYVDLGDVLFLGLPHETKCKGLFLQVVFIVCPSFS